MAGRTVVHDFKNDRTYTGIFSPDGGLSAHAQLVSRAGLNPNDCVGFSIRGPGTGTPYGMEVRSHRAYGSNSETLNRPTLGSCSCDQSSAMARGLANLDTADYTTVSRNGSLNTGRHLWTLMNWHGLQ
ncbi:unnamed protein product [Polarella glacialis]|uniref:Uncharacterized protein n=1 Tax=Polarella glacialis TaxID=89957 RepID=A0A813FF03_POLGL|nr:unnamed protein product [Polarella glacialis]CAE8692642.1 unnamed protein product [Polarella glacialis]